MQCFSTVKYMEVCDRFTTLYCNVDVSTFSMVVFNEFLVLLPVSHDVRIDSKLRPHTWPQNTTQGVRMFHMPDMLYCQGPGPLWRVLPWAPGGRGAISHGRKIEAERRGPWRRRTSPPPPPLGIRVRLWKSSSDAWQKVLIAVLVDKRILFRCR